MRHEISLLSTTTALSVLALTACGGNSGGGDGTNQTAACMNSPLMAHEATNYSFSSTLTFPPIKVKPNAELTFDWGSVTKDFLGHPLKASTDLNTILTMLWDLTLPQLQTKLNADSLAQSDLAVLPLTYPAEGKSSAALYSFTLNGNPIMTSDIMPYFDATMYAPADHIYTMMAATGTTLGQGTRMIQSFQLDPASTNTVVKMTDASTALTYTADLHSLKVTGIKAGSATITLDWGQMTKNALGNPFITTNVTDALIGHYTQTPAELETKFLDLELIASDLYRASIPSGTVLDFSMLKNEKGQAFTGIDTTGTWVVALQCGGCRNPAPWYLSILKPCSP